MQTTQAIAKQQIRECFDCWTESWNRGDLNGYIEGYFDSPSTRYVSGKKVIIGKQNIHQLLESRGGPKGELSLVSFEVEVMSDCNDALCFGQYELKLPTSDKHQEENNNNENIIHKGCFTVHVRKISIGQEEENKDSSWKIISDHST